MTTDVLAGYDEAEPTRRAPWLLVAGAGVLVLGLVGGVTYGLSALSGGGSQPESALPGGAFAFVKVDLDPSAGQKLDGFRFMRRFPALENKLNGDDLRKIAFESVADGAGWDDVDFDSEVAGWMGDRVAIAAYSPADDADPSAAPEVVVALQVTDEGAAREGLKKLAAGAGVNELGFVVAGDYALLAESQQRADQAAQDALDSTLDQDGDLSQDLADAGDGVLTAWIDASRVPAGLGAGGAGMSLMGGPTGLAGVDGRTTVVARFDGPDVFEIAGRVSDAEAASWATHPVRGLAELPGSSVAAVGIADGDKLLMKTFESVRKAMADRPQGDGAPSFDDSVTGAEDMLGLDLPDDLGALLGENLVAAMDGTESGQVEVGARVTTDVTRAEQVLDAVVGASGGAVPLVRRRVGDDLVVASTEKQADRMAAAGTLGDEPAFGRALPDLEAAHLAVWVDVKAVAAALFGGLGSAPGAGAADANMKPIGGVGASVTSGDDGSATYRLRVVLS